MFFDVVVVVFFFLFFFSKISQVVENSYSTQVRQHYLMCSHTKFQLEIPIFFRYVLNFSRVPTFLHILL